MFCNMGWFNHRKNPTNRKQGGPLPVLNRVKWSDIWVTGVTTPVFVELLFPTFVAGSCLQVLPEQFSRSFYATTAPGTRQLDWCLGFFEADSMESLQGNLIQICRCFGF